METIILAINVGLIGLIVGFILGAGVGVVFYRRYLKTGKIPMVDRVAQMAENITRKKVVFAEGMTPKEAEKVKNDERGWGNLINGLKGPAEGVDS